MTKTQTVPTVFVLQHATTGPEGEQVTRLLGVYGTRVAADAAIQRALEDAELSAFPDGFEVTRCELDRDGW